MGNVFLSPGIPLLNMNKFPYGENEWNILLLEPECSTLYSLLYSYNVYKLHMSVNYYNWEVLSLSTKLPFSTPPLSIFRFTEDIHIQILDLHINIFIKIFISVYILMYLRVNFLFTENFLLYHFFFSTLLTDSKLTVFYRSTYIAWQNKSVNISPPFPAGTIVSSIQLQAKWA